MVYKNLSATLLQQQKCIQNKLFGGERVGALPATSVFIKQPRGMECGSNALLSFVIPWTISLPWHEERERYSTTPPTQTAFCTLSTFVAVVLRIQCIPSISHGAIACKLCQSCCRTVSELLWIQNAVQMYTV